MNLLIDIGNTRNKFAISNGNTITDTIAHDTFSVSEVKTILKKYSDIDAAILSTVKNIDTTVLTYLKDYLKYFIEFDENTPIPIENLYQTKNTLGKDRLAAVVGAYNIYPNSNVLVIDMGTAITYDFMNNDNQYLGGTISPGLEMRFKALNHFTDKLPLLEKDDSFRTIAKNTREAIVSGVQNGVIFEVDGYINTLKTELNDLKIILTGGDAIFFDKKLKNTIFVNLNLNNIGLNTILEYNKPDE